MSSKAILRLSKLSAGLNGFGHSEREGDEGVVREYAGATVYNEAPIALQDRRQARHPSASAVSGALGGRSKRALDLFVASSAILLLSPLMIVVSALIYLTMGRPIFYAQRRVGFGGRSFPCFKFRTMVHDAEAVLLVHLKQNSQAATEWGQRQKLTYDPRVTGLGRILRRSSIDELPQLFGVLQGHMSCVGPRPVLEQESKRYGSYWNDYVRARPGLTGVWQVSGRNRLTYERRVSLDRWYVRKWSIWTDLAILVRTIPAVLRMDDTA